MIDDNIMLNDVITELILVNSSSSAVQNGFIIFKCKTKSTVHIKKKALVSQNRHTYTEVDTKMCLNTKQ